LHINNSLVHVKALHILELPTDQNHVANAGIGHPNGVEPERILNPIRNLLPGQFDLPRRRTQLSKDIIDQRIR